MIIKYTPSLDHVLDVMFNKCIHLKASGFCDICNREITKLELMHKIELREALDPNSYYICRENKYVKHLEKFLRSFGVIEKSTILGGSRHEYCYTIMERDKKDKIYSPKTGLTYVQSICWFSEILIRHLDTYGMSEEEIRSILNAE